MKGSFMKIARGLPLASLLALSSAALADPLEQMVGADQALAMGLQKLSVAERAELARWIERHLDGRPVPVMTPTVEFTFDGVTVQAGLASPASVTTVAAAVAPVAAPSLPVAIGTTAAFGLDQDAVDGGLKQLRARVLGEFKGWDGKTRFTLDNGQIWRQSTPGVYRFKSTDPEVTIEKGLLGYKMRLVETKRSIAVRRVK